MDVNFDPADIAFRAEVRAFLAERLPERWTGIFSGGPESLKVSWDICRELAQRGWLTGQWPAEYGGHEWSIWRQTVLQEELWAHGEPRGGQYYGVNWVGPAIMRFGTEAQRAYFLPRIARGEIQFAQLFSESEAGSDVAAVRTSAILDGDEFVLTGEKVWTSYADFAQHGFLLARSDQDAERHHGLSVLLIDMTTPGIEVRLIPTALGDHRLLQVVFDDVHVPATTLLGGLHDGWRVATTALSFERSGTARYARVTRVLGHVSRNVDAVDHPGRAPALHDAFARGRAAELTNYLVVAMKERGEVPSWQASAARVHNALYEQEVAALAEEIIGTDVIPDIADASCIAGGEVENLVRVAPTATVTAGTYEVQMSLIAERALGLTRSR